MGIDITEIGQKVLDNNTNAANVFRKMYDLHYNPNPIDVPFEYIDENGNKVTTTIKNQAGFRKKVWDDVGAALGQFSRTFYVDQVNGDDDNDGSSANPFKTLKKAIDSVPIGGYGQIKVLSDITIYKNIEIINKTIIVENIATGALVDFSDRGNFKWLRTSFSLTNPNTLNFITIINSTLILKFFNIETPIKQNNNNDDFWFNAIFARDGMTNSSLIFYACNIFTNDYLLFHHAPGYGGLINIHLWWTYIQQKNPQVFVFDFAGGGTAGAITTDINDPNRFMDENGSQKYLKDMIGGIVRDANGKCINIVSNFEI